MSFFSKIVEKKGLVIGLVAAAVAVGGFVLYKSYENEGKEDLQADDDGLDLQREIDGLKTQINMGNPSIDDVKQILTFSMSFAKKKIYSYSRQFKQKRRQFTNKTRKENMKEYMNVVSNGMEEVRNIATNTQAEIMKQLGLSEAVFIKYQNQLGMFMQELMMRQAQGDTGVKELTLEEVKYAVRLQTEYLRAEGEEILDKILEATKNWPPAKKSELPLLLSVVIADGAFEDHPEIDEQAVQAAEMKLQHHLRAEMTELQQVMSPLMRKLSMEIGGMGGMGMGGMGGMGMGGMDMGDMEGMEGMGMEGFTAEQMQQLQQLEQMRMQDPAAFEEMMRSMYG